MSLVTNVVVSCSILDTEKLPEVNKVFKTGRGQHCCNNVGLNDVGDAAGGCKALETPLWVGAFNYFLKDNFLEHIRQVEWQQPEAAQVFVKEHEDDTFVIYTL